MDTLKIVALGSLSLLLFGCQERIPERPKPLFTAEHIGSGGVFTWLAIISFGLVALAIARFIFSNDNSSREGASIGGAAAAGLFLIILFFSTCNIHCGGD